MCHLLLDPSSSIKKTSYSLLHQTAKPRTEHLIIEAGVDSSSDFTPELPPELLSVIDRSLNYDHSRESQVNDVILLAHLCLSNVILGFTRFPLRVDVGV